MFYFKIRVNTLFLYNADTNKQDIITRQTEHNT